MTSVYGFKCSFNPTFAAEDPRGKGWISKGYYGLDQGPVVIMIENYLSGFLWNLMKKCPYVVSGLQRPDLKAAGVTTGMGSTTRGSGWVTVTSSACYLPVTHPLPGGGTDHDGIAVPLLRFRTQNQPEHSKTPQNHWARFSL